LWRALPAIEELQTAWEAKCDDPRYRIYKPAITDGLNKLNKYYSRFDEKPGFILALGNSLIGRIRSFQLTRFAVLHPYYKLAYIKLAWGGEKEQAEDRAAGNRNAKNWQDEARKMVEETVRAISPLPGPIETGHSQMEKYWKA